ncbi:Tethering factor for nuclear proteasome STS1 [Exophiala dermatitidis]
MNSLATPPIPPHFHEHTRLSPTRSMSGTAPSRKRKASPSPDRDDEMSTSPAITNARLPHTLTPSSRKRARPNLAGRALSVDRLLETLDQDALRGVLKSVYDRNPGLRDEIIQVSPRPSIQSTLQVLRKYYNRLMASFPLDPNRKSDYCYDRVRGPYHELLEALGDFTPHFLPPNEQQSSTSLEYLNGVTDIIHDLPDWDNPQHNLAKQNAYEEISKAWASVIREASKRGAGIQLQYSGWEEKLRAHNEKSGGRLREAYEALVDALGWLRPNNQPTQQQQQQQQQQQSIRQQLFSNTYGMEQPTVRTGNW